MIHYLGLGGYFDDYIYHDSLQASLIGGMDHSLQLFYVLFYSKRWLFRLEAVRCVLKDLWRWGANTKENMY